MASKNRELRTVYSAEHKPIIEDEGKVRKVAVFGIA
jgi:hypothetical protein